MILVLVGGFNQNVYMDSLMRRLLDPDLGILEQILEIRGEEMPPTHVRGKRLVCEVYAITGVEGVTDTVLERHTGVGDHRPLMLDFKPATITGNELPRIVTPAARLLDSSSERTREQYNKVPEELCDRHRMIEQLLWIQRIPMKEEDIFIREMNKWDK